MTAEEFDEGYFERLQAAAGHWWVRGMREVGAAILGPVATPADVLDLGCGSGANLAWLAGLSQPKRVQAIDRSEAALDYCRRLNEPVDLQRASATALPFGEACFDLVVSMDVLQHLTEGDAALTLAELRRVLRPGGRALIRTNAAFGRRRVPQRADWRLYDRSGLATELAQAGLRIERISAVNTLQGLWTSLPRPVLSLPGARRGPADHDSAQKATSRHGLGIPRAVSARRNRAMLALLRVEARWLTRPGRHLPVGHSLYAVASRPR